MRVITKILNFVAVVLLTKCIIELFQFLRWDYQYPNRLPIFIGQNFEIDSFLRATFFDLGLLIIFLSQHRLVAYIKHSSRVDISPIYGAVYVITSSLALLLLVTYWVPTPSITAWSWDVQSYPLLVLFFQFVYLFSWAIVILENMVYIVQTHDLQISQRFSHKRNVNSPATPHLWNLRGIFPHPGLIFFTVILWMTPTLTFDRWLLAAVLSCYIYVPKRITKKDYMYFCQCYSYVTYEDHQMSY